MADLLLLTTAPPDGPPVVPALALLHHRVHLAPPEARAALSRTDADVVVVDGRADLALARGICRTLQAAGVEHPVLLVLGEGGLPVVGADWGVADIVLATAGPAELDARLRLLVQRADDADMPGDPDQIEAGDLTIDPGGYTARLRGVALNLTYKEFELLRFLTQHPGRVFTRAQLLQEVWGYDYFGGTRTVDVHVRRLRAKLGPEHDQLIGTVRNVGYRFDLPAERTPAEPPSVEAPDAEPRPAEDSPAESPSTG